MHKSHRPFHWVLSVAAILVATSASTPLVRGQAEDDLPAHRQAAIQRIPSSAAIGAIAHPRRILTAPGMEMLPVEVVSAAGRQQLGFDPAGVEFAIAAIEPPVAGPPAVVVGLRFVEPFDWKQLSAALLDRTVDGQLNGQSYRQGRTARDMSIFMPNERWLIIGTDALLRRVADREVFQAEGTVATLLEKGADHDLHAALAMDPLRPLLIAQLQQAPPLPPGLEELKKAPNLIKAIELHADIEGGNSALRVHATDAAAADRLQQLLETALQSGERLAREQAQRAPIADDPVALAGRQYMERMIGMMFQTFRPKQEGDSLVLRTEGAQQAQVASTGVAIALLLPAVQAAREAARRANSTNKIKQLALGMLNYESVHGHYPAHANYDSDGKPLLSWRVHILPFLDQLELYEQFRLDEPWDSEHNRPLIDRMPEVFASPSLPAAGTTPYLAIRGPHALFAGREGRKIREVVDGTSHTIMLVEANESVPWTKPSDLTYAPDNPHSGLGKIRPGGFIAGFADGSVRFIVSSLEPESLTAMFTIDQQDVVAK